MNETEVDVDAARKVLAEARKRDVQACQEELAGVLNKYHCSLVTHQEWINGMPKGPAQVMVVPTNE